MATDLFVIGFLTLKQVFFVHRVGYRAVECLVCVEKAKIAHIFLTQVTDLKTIVLKSP